MIDKKHMNTDEEADSKALNSSNVSNVSAVTTSNEEAQTSAQTWFDKLLQILHKQGSRLRIGGILLVIVAGFINNCIFGWNIDIFNGGNLVITLRLGILLMALIGFISLRTWWTLLIGPAAWLVGGSLAVTLVPLIQNTWPAVQAAIERWNVHLLPSILLISFIVLFGAIIGSLIKRRSTRQQ